MTISSLRLAFSFLVILVLVALFKPHWIPHDIRAYIYRNWTTSGTIAALTDEMEELEHLLSSLSNVADSKSLPEDLRQRVAKLPGLLRR